MITADYWRIYVLGSNYDFDRSIRHPKFDPTGVRTHDLQIINSNFHVLETPIVTTRLPGTKVIKDGQVIRTGISGT